MQGEVVYLYAFDVANEIATEKIHDILASKPFPFEIRTDHTVPKDVPLYRPLAIEPPAMAARLGGRKVRLLVRVYDVGVVSIAMHVPFGVESLAELLPYHKSVLDNGLTLDQAARDLCSDVCKSLADALIDRLSKTQIAEVLRIQRSYTKTDIVVIDWDAALVIDLGGYFDDVLYVLELANLQLEEYRVMDHRLDRHLDRAYDDLKRRRFGLFGTYSATLARLRLFRVDVTKLSDEVTHISKFFGDWYLARVYLGAAERFYLNQWRVSVEDRLGQLDRLYSVVNADINNRRMVVLEVLVLVFFAIDLLLIVFLRR
jgi:hypothetical protein